MAWGGKKWTAREDVQMLTLYIGGHTADEIGKSLCRSTTAVEQRMSVLRNKKGVQVNRKHTDAEALLAEPIKAPAAIAQRKRPCLCCGASFFSSGPGNRLCSECRRLSVSPYAI